MMLEIFDKGLDRAERSYPRNSLGDHLSDQLRHIAAIRSGRHVIDFGLLQGASFDEDDRAEIRAEILQKVTSIEYAFSHLSSEALKLSLNQAQIGWLQDVLSHSAEPTADARTAHDVILDIPLLDALVAYFNQYAVAHRTKGRFRSSPRDDGSSRLDETVSVESPDSVRLQEGRVRILRSIHLLALPCVTQAQIDAVRHQINEAIHLPEGPANNVLIYRTDRRAILDIVLRLNIQSIQK